MRGFAELSSIECAKYPVVRPLWTVYHMESNPYRPCSFDWGVCLAYHFDQGVAIEPWLALAAAVREWVEGYPALRELIAFVPFYEAGADFFAQCKPPYDGGYSTASYESFLYHRECAPAPWFYRQLAELHEGVAETARDLRHGQREALLARIVHATFLRPYNHLFWRDRDGWAVYQPNINPDDVHDWLRLDT
ncbi:MAG TPA: hypothetical protein VD886_21665 [Herpetosiphonaceae bacterium]|nr:hypothetical protein [Herpetosiphonaceae bacterium]